MERYLVHIVKKNLDWSRKMMFTPTFIDGQFYCSGEICHQYVSDNSTIGDSFCLLDIENKTKKNSICPIMGKVIKQIKQGEENDRSL